MSESVEQQDDLNTSLDDNLSKFGEFKSIVESVINYHKELQEYKEYPKWVEYSFLQQNNGSIINNTIDVIAGKLYTIRLCNDSEIKLCVLMRTKDEVNSHGDRIIEEHWLHLPSNTYHKLDEVKRVLIEKKNAEVPDKRSLIDNITPDVVVRWNDEGL